MDADVKVFCSLLGLVLDCGFDIIIIFSFLFFSKIVVQP